MAQFQKSLVYQAYIQELLPSQGLAVISSIAGQKQRKIVNLPSNVLSYGTTIRQLYNIGCKVLVHRGSDQAADHIIGIIPQAHDQPLLGVPDIANCGLFPHFYQFSNTAIYKAILNNARQHTNKLYQYVPLGSYADSYAGDTLITDTTGGGLFVGRSQLLLQQGSAAQLRITGFDNKVSVMGQKLQTLSLTTVQQINPNINKKLIAANINQRFGARADTPALKIDNQRITTKEASMKPFYRYQQLDGAVINGHSQSILIQNPDTQLITDVPQQVIPVQQYRVDYNGAVSQQSSRSIRQIKTPNILSIMQGYVAPTDAQATRPTMQQPQASVNIALYLAAYYQNIFNINSQQYPSQLVEVASQQQLCLNKTGIPGLSAYQPEYQDAYQSFAQPAQVSLTDKQNQTTTKYKNTISFINQQDDGSIILKDGWGSQIRMHGGNIYISSALDTFIRPGRDCISITPRLHQIEANGALTISSKESIRVGSQRDICLSSGISGQTAKTVIQNRSSSDKKAGAGVVVRSNGDLSVTSSNDLYIGLNDKTTKNAQDKVTRNTTGKLFIDGGMQACLLADDIKLLSTTNLDLIGATSRLTLNTGSYWISSAIFCDSSLTMKPVSLNSIQCLDKKFEAKGATSRPISTQGDIRSRMLIAQKGVQTMGSIVGLNFMSYFSPQLIIPSMSGQSKDDFFKVFKTEDLFKKINLTLSSVVDMSCLNDSYICDKQFRFIDYSKYISPQYKLPGLCWQQQAKNILEQASTSITGSSDKSYPYPGKPLNQLLISKFNVQSNKLVDVPCITGYTVNRSNYKEYKYE